jgi:hypothetical protein
MLADAQLEVRKVFIEVFLKHIVADCISILMLAILISMLLETIVCQVNIVVPV